MNNIQSAIEAAKANAAAVVPSNSQGEVQAYTQPGRAMTADDFMNATSGADGWIKVVADGIKVGDSKLFEELTVKLDFSMVDYYWSLSYSNPPIYEKSKDRVLSAKGQPWSQVVQKAMQSDPRCKGDFASAFLPLEVIEPIKGKSGDVIVEEGDILGYALPYTGAKAFAQLKKKLEKEGIDTNNDTILLTIGGEGGSNAAGNNYAKIRFIKAVLA